MVRESCENSILDHIDWIESESVSVPHWSIIGGMAPNYDMVATEDPDAKDARAE